MNAPFLTANNLGEAIQAAFSAPPVLDDLTTKPRMEAYSPFRVT